MKIATDVTTPRTAFAGIEEYETIHGLTNGTWSFIDAIQTLLTICGPSDVFLSTWTAANADISRAETLLKSRFIKSWCMAVDYSFKTRQPAYCENARRAFGDDAIRVWNCHAKFLILHGDAMSCLYLTSANLNKNKRVENFTLTTNRKLVDEYDALVKSLYETQLPGEGFDRPMIGKRQTDEIYHAHKTDARQEN